MLETRDLTLRLHGRTVLDAVSCTFRPGTLTAIVGPPGAGKSCLLDLIAGQRRPSAGSVLLRGRELTRASVPQRVRRGVARGFQRAQAFVTLSVVDNVQLAVQARRGEGLNLWSRWSAHRNTLERAHALVERVHLGERAHECAGSLGPADRRRLEVALLMAVEPAVYLFDSPAAGLDARDAMRVLELVHALLQQRDKTIVLAAQRLDEVREVAGRAVVLYRGRVLADDTPARLMASPAVMQAWLDAAPAALAR